MSVIAHSSTSLERRQLRVCVGRRHDCKNGEGGEILNLLRQLTRSSKIHGERVCEVEHYYVTM